MGEGTGRQADTLRFYDELSASPYRYDFYQALRRLECLHDTKPRWGQALRPIDEAVRFGQDPDLSFAPAALASFERPDGRTPRLQVRLFGLFGPNGPLPLHLTEYARERLKHAGDPTFSRFLDMFHHRFLALFYRAWAQAQPHVNHDRPKADRFTVYIGAFVGMAPSALRNRDRLPDLAKFFHVGALIRQVRNTEGLKHILEHFFRVPVAIEEYVGHRMFLRERDRTFLGGEGAPLGRGAVLGRTVWDRQHKFRIHLGPLTLAQHQDFLPGGAMLGKLVDWVRMYFGFELNWDVRLQLQPEGVPMLTLGKRQRLGFTTWLGHRQSSECAGDLCFDAEAAMDREGVAEA